MKNFTLAFLLVAGFSLLKAQNVGIGTSTPAEKLHVNGNVRVDPLANADSSLVFADVNGTLKLLPAGTAGDVLISNGPGAAPSWGSNLGSEWLLTGNTLAGTEFIGSLNNQPFMMYTNNLQRARITGGGQFVVNYTAAPIAGDVFSSFSTGGNVAMAGYNLAGAGEVLYLQQQGSGDAMMSVVTAAGTGDLSFHRQMGSGLGHYTLMDNNSIGYVSDVSTAGGVGYYGSFLGEDGTGYYVDSLGDGYSFFSNNRTLTPTSGGTVFGAVLAGQQSGVGHGIIINHSGAQGRNAEFNMNNPANTEEAIQAIHLGQGSAIVGQNQNNAITGVIAVADFAYAGTDVDDHRAVYAQSTPAAGWGIGVQGVGNFYGVFSSGDFGATGTKTFLIDHPQDPANKFLRHFSIESNEVLNMYRGVIQLDASGQATVQLPGYFSAVNTNFSYQLTAIGTSTQPYVVSEIQNNQFVVGGAANTKVSWMVIANRNDLYIQNNPDKTTDEFTKTGSRAGKYLNPDLYNQPADMGMFNGGNQRTPATGISKPAMETPSKSAEDMKMPETDENGATKVNETNAKPEE